MSPLKSIAQLRLELAANRIELARIKAANVGRRSLKSEIRQMIADLFTSPKS